MSNEDPFADELGTVSPEESPLADPRLLERALRRMRSLLKGNGVEDLSKIELGGLMNVRQYRFPASVEVKLVPKYGIKIEPGKNMLAELVVSQDDFQKKVHHAVLDARQIPEKRQHIVDFIFSRADKGFGIKEQMVTFRDLTRDLVRHEQCQACNHSGKQPCPKCRGIGMVTCLQCRGIRQVNCRKCGGSGRMKTAHGLQPCDMCRADGKVPCAACGAKGQVRCRSCAATGKLACQKCSGTGWLSHLAHVKIEGQVRFFFQREGLPPRLVALIENKAAFLVSKGDIEVALRKQPVVAPQITGMGDDVSRAAPSHEPEDMVILEYDATCPYGELDFVAEDRTIPAVLLGWHARLIDAPAFLEDYTRNGMDAIRAAAEGKGAPASLLQRAGRYALWREMITQVLLSGNRRKIASVMMNRYTVGISGERLLDMAGVTNRAVRRVTFVSRVAGLVLGLLIYGGVAFWFFWMHGRGQLYELLSLQLPEIVKMAVDILLLLGGALVANLCGRVAAIFSQQRAFSGLVDAAVLKAKLPHSGQMVWWALGGSFIITAFLLVAGLILKVEGLPEWIGTG